MCVCGGGYLEPLISYFTGLDGVVMRLSCSGCACPRGAAFAVDVRAHVVGIKSGCKVVLYQLLLRKGLGENGHLVEVSLEVIWRSLAWMRAADEQLWLC